MRPILKNYLLIVLSISIGFFVAETALMIFELPEFEQARRVEFTGGLRFYVSPKMEYLIHRIKPHTSYLNIYGSNPRNYFAENNTITLSANNEGFRGQDFARTSESGIIKIAFLGDSFTLGEGVKFEDIYSEKTAAILNTARSLKSRGLYAKSYNYGMLAYNTTQEYIILLEEVLSLNPEIIVLGYFLNDAAGPYFKIHPETDRIIEDPLNPFWYGTGTRPPETFLYTFYTSRLIWKFIHQRNTRHRTITYYSYLYSQHNPHWPSNRALLKSIIEICENRKIPLIILCFPVLYRLNEAYPFKHIHKMVERIAHSSAKEYTTYIDSFPSFQGIDAKTLWVHPSDHHPNEKAHHIIAEILVKTISEKIEMLHKQQNKENGTDS